MNDSGHLPHPARTKEHLMASKRGFAAMSLEKRRAIAAKGGRSSHRGSSSRGMKKTTRSR
jgi:hypothetical protein